MPDHDPVFFRLLLSPTWSGSRILTLENRDEDWIMMACPVFVSFFLVWVFYLFIFFLSPTTRISRRERLVDSIVWLERENESGKDNQRLGFIKPKHNMIPATHFLIISFWILLSYFNWFL